MGMNPNVEYADIDSLVKEGYLQEVNRLFFHPRGLALEFCDGFTRADVEKILLDRGYHYGDDAVDNVMTAVHLFGLDVGHFSGVWDYREDDEGIAFADDVLTRPDAVDKARQVHNAAQEHLPYRSKYDPRGTGVQALPGWSNDTDRP